MLLVVAAQAAHRARHPRRMMRHRAGGETLLE